MTYSIVAHDPKSGQLGVAVQSHWFSVGSVVTWAESGVGEEARTLFTDIVAREPGWAELVRRLPAAGLLRNGETTIKRLLE